MALGFFKQLTKLACLTVLMCVSAGIAAAQGVSDGTVNYTDTTRSAEGLSTNQVDSMYAMFENYRSNIITMREAQRELRRDPDNQELQTSYTDARLALQQTKQSYDTFYDEALAPRKRIYHLNHN